MTVMRQTSYSRYMPNGELLTSPQAGAVLGKSARTVQRMADAGELLIAQKLPGPNGAYLFRRSDVEALLAPVIADKPEAAKAPVGGKS